MTEPRVECVMTTDGRTLMIERVYQRDSTGNYVVVVRTSQVGPWNLRNAEMALIREAMELTGGNRTKVAELLGIHVRTLRRKLNGGK